MGSARPIEGRLSVAAQGALATNGQELVPTCTNGLLYISLCSWYKKNIKKLPKSVKASIQDMGFPAINIHKPRCPGAPGALHPCAHLHIHWHFDPWWAMPSHEKLTAFLAPGRRFLTQLECKDVDVDDESWAYQPWKWFTLIHHVIPIRYDANQSSFLRLTFFYPFPDMQNVPVVSETISLTLLPLIGKVRLLPSRRRCTGSPGPVVFIILMWWEVNQEVDQIPKKISKNTTYQNISKQRIRNARNISE